MSSRLPHLKVVLVAVALLAMVAIVGFPVLESHPVSSSSPAVVPASTIVVRPHVARTPIQHVVVIFDENVSFDHYFATYPVAANTSGEPFYAAPGTPKVNGLTPTLLNDNPNGVNPQRLDPSNIDDLLTCDQNHDYQNEQFAFDGGKMDKFTASGGTATTTGTSPTGQTCTDQTVMDYYDGNAVTAMWNYAQHFAMSDDAFGTTYGPSAIGAINLVSGETGGVDPDHSIRGSLAPYPTGDVIGDGNGGYTLVNDAQPYWDDCSSRDAVAMTGSNVGDQLNSAGLSWGWFQAGFDPQTKYTGTMNTASNYNPLTETGNATCTTEHDVGTALGGTGTTGTHAWGTKSDYIPHHEPFQYYASTANPHHLLPTSLSVVGTDTATPGEFNTANHQYDASTFNSLMAAIRAKTVPATHFPAVSFLKPPGYEDGHAGYSDPIDEQHWLVNEINAIESLPTWSSTAIIVTYDDSDGWYDHVYSGVVNPSQTAADALDGAGSCGTGTTYLYNQAGRCGHGPRLPFLVISPYARPNFVSNTPIDQSSILAFIEYNWSLGQIPGSFANIAGSLLDMFDFTKGAKATPALILSPTTGEPSFPVVGKIAPTTGLTKGGTTVTIDGINFVAGKTAIYFGKTAATKVTCSKTTVCTAVSPAEAAGKVTVSAVVNKVASANDASSFSYTS